MTTEKPNAWKKHEPHDGGDHREAEKKGSLAAIAKDLYPFELHLSSDELMLRRFFRADTSHIETITQTEAYRICR